ncbi:Mitotic apparatus protein [Tritrichomonas foetus]|uniref:Mitotic apparatus protein n=1 Tax=Tritrichomonas foetus TaxID=1144522 RepID=A0A1J4J395_9EUKA|nr:Mitotic apparatus protein [Tritrichomonas foetus]|eukprot:OHS93217.1 Mitotic apparatus protein [Tritrichomonas foetus]
MSDTSTPPFDYTKDHELKPKEKVFVIDPNGYDLWAGVVQSNENGKVAIHYPEYPDEDEVIEGDAQKRILYNNRTNSRIYNNQEMKREEKDQPDSEEEEEPSESSESEESTEGEYKPVNAPPADKDSKKNKKKGKGKKNKKGKKDVVRPRPEGARSNPRRGAANQ